MKKLAAIFFVALLGACASPAQNMTEHQISQLSDIQLCQLKRAYAYEPKTEVEIGKRKVNCHPAYLECEQKGFKRGTAELSICADQLVKQADLQKKIDQQQKELERQERQIKTQKLFHETQSIMRSKENSTPNQNIIINQY